MTAIHFPDTVPDGFGEAVKYMRYLSCFLSAPQEDNSVEHDFYAFVLLLFATSNTNRNTLIAIFAERFFRTKSDTLYQFRPPQKKMASFVRNRRPPRR